MAASKVASFVWRSEEACKNRVLEFAAVGIVACFSRFCMRGHTLSASAGAHRPVELECWLRSINEVTPFSCSPADLLRSELLDQDHRAPRSVDTTRKRAAWSPRRWVWGDFDAGWSPATVGTVAAVRPDADSQGIRRSGSARSREAAHVT